MSSPARVHSIEALQDFRAALGEFAQKVSTALESAEMEIQRTLQWLKLDQQRYWKVQIRHRSEVYTQATLALKRKQHLEKSPLGGAYSYIDERRAVATAKSRLEEAQTKYQNVRHWIVHLEEEAYTYKAAVRSLLNVVEIDVPNARSDLDAMTAALERYLSVATPGEEQSGESTEQTAEMARPKQESQPGEVSDYQVLRELTPEAVVRRELPQGRARCSWLAGDELSVQEREIIGQLAAAGGAFTGQEKVIVAKPAGTPRRVYLERVGLSDEAEGLWYVGAGEGDLIGYEAISIATLLEMRPDFAELVNLPIGYLVMISDGQMEAIVDAAGRTVWAKTEAGAQ